MEETRSMLRISEEIPIFGGDEALEWIQRLEVVLRGVSEEEKLQASMEALEGRALTWFQWWKRCNPNPLWEGFKIAVVRRFQPSMIQNPFELLLSLKQDETAEDYVKDFEKYAGALREIDPEFVKDTFLKGLKEEIRIEVQSYEFHSLSEIIQKTIFVAQERTGSEFASEAEGNETSEAEATPENVNHDTTAVEVIQKQGLETEGESKTRAEEKERVAAETEQERALTDERASSTVAIERFSLKLTHHGGRDFIGEPPNLDFPLMVRGSFQRPPPTPPDKAVRLLRERGSSEWSRRPASKLLDPYPCRSPEGKQPPPEPPDLSVGYSEVFPLLIGQAVREGKTHRRLGWRCTERAEVKAWINNPNGPSPNLIWKALGHAGDWAQIRKGIHGDNLEAENQMTWANEYVTNQTRPCALELGLCRDINTATEARISEKMVVELKVFINTVDENRKRYEVSVNFLFQRLRNHIRICFNCSGGWPNTSHMAELLQRRLSYKLEWYSVPELLFHWQTSAWSCNPHVLADLVTGYQSLNSQISEFNVWVWRQEKYWRHQHIGDSWTFTQFGSLGGGFIVGADSLTGLLVNLLAGYEKLPTNSFVHGFALNDAAILLPQPICINGIFCKLCWTLCFRLWDPGGSYDCLSWICGVAVHVICPSP